MARTALFHGRVIVHPGAEAYVDLTGMVQPNADVTQIAGIVAEAPTGEPGVLHIFADSQPATQLFGEGSDAAEAVKQLLDTSPDSNVENGAALVYVYIASKNRQAEYWLCARPVNNVAGVSLAGADYTFTTVAAARVSGVTNAYVDIASPTGVLEDHFQNLIVEVTGGWGKGQQRQVITSSDQGGGVYRLNLRDGQDWDIAPFQSGVTTTIRILVPVIELLSSDWGPNGNLNKVHVIPESSTDPDDGYKLSHKYNNITEVTASAVGGTKNPSFTLRFDPTGGSTTTTNWLRGQSGSKILNTYTPADYVTDPISGTVLNGGTALGSSSEEVGRWLVATNTIRSASKTTIDAFVSSNNASLFSGSAVPGDIMTGSVSSTKAVLLDFTGGVVKFCQMNGNIDAGGEDFVGSSGTIRIAVGFTQTPASVGTAGLFTVGETVTGAPSGATGVFIEETSAGELVLANVSGTFADSDALTSATAAREGETPIGTTTSEDPLYDSHIEIIGNMYKVKSHTATAATLVAPGIGFSPGAGLELKPMQLTDIQLKVSGRNGVAETLTVQIKDDKSSPAYDQAYQAYDLTATGYSTLLSLRDKINQDTWMTAALGDGVAPDTSPARFDFGEAADSHELTTASDRVVKSNLIYGHGAGTTYNATIDGPLGQLTHTTVVRDNVQKLVDWINTNHGRFTAARATDAGLDNSTVGYAKEVGGGEPIDFASVFKVFYGGLSGTSQVRKGATTDADYPVSWEHGFEQMLTQDAIRVEIPCASATKTGWATTDIETLLTDFQTHLIDAHAARMYRNGYFGLHYPLEAGTYSGTNYSKGLLEWIATLDDENLSLCGQEIRDTLTTGADGWLPAWALACKVASMQLGTDLGEGFSLKQILASNIRSPIGDWEPTDTVQSYKATLGGLLYVRPLRGTFRITRGSTTHVSTDNLARTDINVWEIRNHLIREIQILLEDRFIGAGVGLPGEGVRFVARASVPAIREAVATFLEDQRAEGIIVDSIKDGRRQRAWHSLRVTISGDIARVSVNVYPKTALNFILVDFAFQLPVQSG